MDDLSRIFADQVRLDLLHRLGARQSSAFEDRLTQTDDAGVGVHLQE